MSEAPVPEVITAKELARRLGRHPAAIHRAVRLGYIRKRPDGLFDTASAMHDYRTNLDQSAANRSPGRPKGSGSASARLAPANAATQPQGAAGPDLNQSRRVAAYYRAKRAQLDVEERLRNLAPRAEVHREAC